MREKILMCLLTVIVMTGLTGCGGKKEETIIDHVKLYETTITDIEEYLKDRDIVYKINDDRTYIMTQLNQDFLGYSSYYGFEFVDCYVDDRYDDRYNEEIFDEPVLKTMDIRVGFKSTEEFVDGGNEITKLFKEKSKKMKDYEVLWDTENDITYYPIKTSKVKINNEKKDFVSYIEYESRYTSDNIEQGYVNNWYLVEYHATENWNELAYIIDRNNGYTTTAEAANTIETDSNVQTPAESSVTDTKTESPVAEPPAATTATTEAVAKKTQIEYSDTNYQGAYANYLMNYVPSNEMDLGFGLGYVDNDDIPELFIFDGTSHADGVNVYTYQDGEVVALGQYGQYGFIEYAPQEGILINAVDGMGSFIETYMRLDHGQTKELCTLEGTDVDIPEETKYFIDGTQVSEEEYDSKSKEMESLYSRTVFISFDDAYEISDESISNLVNDKNFGLLDSSKLLENVDVEAEVKQIREYYTTTQNNLDSYMIQDEGDMVMYHEQGFPVKIVVHAGYNDWDYTREYYYHDKQLYFAFIYKKGEEHRLYFKHDTLIRYIDENKNIYDYGDLKNFSDWEDRVLYESDNIYPDMINCGA